MRDGVHADVAVEDYHSVELERFTSCCGSGKDDVGIEGLLLFMQFVGYECGFAGDLF